MAECKWNAFNESLLGGSRGVLTGSERQQADLEKHIVNVKSVNVFQSEGKLNFSNSTTNKLFLSVLGKATATWQLLTGSSYYCGGALVPIIDGALLTEGRERERGCPWSWRWKRGEALWGYLTLREWSRSRCQLRVAVWPESAYLVSREREREVSTQN